MARRDDDDRDSGFSAGDSPRSRPRSDSSGGSRRARRDAGDSGGSPAKLILLILGLVLGIPAVIAVLVLCVIFGLAYWGVKKGVEGANELAKEMDRQVQEDRDRVNRIRLEQDRKKRELEEAIAKKKALPLDKIPGTNMSDLIALVDPVKDANGRAWEIFNNELHCRHQGARPRIEIPYQPPMEYDFIVTFSQKNLRNGISLIMPKPAGMGGGSYYWHIGDGSKFPPKGDFCGFGGKSDKVIPGLIRENIRYTTKVQVRVDGVKGFLNDQELVSVNDVRSLTVDNWRTMRDPTVLGVDCDDPTVFHEVRLIEVTGRGKRTR
jgi:hypothetical protein